MSPFHTASGRVAIVTISNSTVGAAKANITYPSGMYDIAVNYYDLIGGRSNFEIYINNNTIGLWNGDHEDKLGHASSIYIDGHSATRITFKGIEVHKGDVLKIVGKPDGIEPAPIDYVSFLPTGIVD